MNKRKIVRTGGDLLRRDKTQTLWTNYMTNKLIVTEISYRQKKDIDLYRNRKISKCTDQMHSDECKQKIFFTSRQNGKMKDTQLICYA